VITTCEYVLASLVGESDLEVGGERVTLVRSTSPARGALAFGGSQAKVETRFR